MEKHLIMNHVTVGYEKAILKDFNLSVAYGECVGIIGPNGAGKSTCLKSISKLLPLKSGKIMIEGIDVNEISSKQLARKVAVVNQSTEISFNYKVSDIVRLGRYAHEDQSLAAVQEYMEYTNVWLFRDRGVNELSGGERQRVIISQALAQEAKLLLMDEPTSDLDLRHQVDMFNVLEEMRRKQKLTIIAIMHDLNLAALYCDRLVALKEGRIVVDGTPQEVLTPANLKDIFGVDVQVEHRAENNQPVVILRKNAD